MIRQMARPFQSLSGCSVKCTVSTVAKKKIKRLKGIAKVIVKKDLRFDDCKSTLFREIQQQCHMTTIRSHGHQIFSEISQRPDCRRSMTKGT